MSEIQIWTTAAPSDADFIAFLVVSQTKSRNVFVNVGGIIQGLIGGEVMSITELTRELRRKLLATAKRQAASLGANAIVGIKFETSTIFDGVVDIVLYGTAVNIKSLNKNTTSLPD